MEIFIVQEGFYCIYVFLLARSKKKRPGDKKQPGPPGMGGPGSLQHKQSARDCCMAAVTACCSYIPAQTAARLQPELWWQRNGD